MQESKPRPRAQTTLWRSSCALWDEQGRRVEGAWECSGRAGRPAVMLGLVTREGGPHRMSPRGSSGTSLLGAGKPGRCAEAHGHGARVLPATRLKVFWLAGFLSG